MPKGRSAVAVAQVIRDRFFSGYREAEFLVVCDVKKESSQVIQELNDAQVIKSQCMTWWELMKCSEDSWTKDVQLQETGENYRMWGFTVFSPLFAVYSMCTIPCDYFFCYTSICKSKISHCTCHLSNSETSNHYIAYIIYAPLQFLKSPVYPGALLQHLTCNVCGTIVTKSEFLQKACKVKVYLLGTTVK